MPIRSAWAQQLQPASFNGIPFIIEYDTYNTGRRVAIHEYYGRDNPFLEDMGKNTRTISFSAFLVGDDCYAQRDAMKTACEQQGNGPLVHPSIGQVTAALVSAGFTERADRGRVVEVNLNFVVVDDKPIWPTTDVDTQSATEETVGELQSAAEPDFMARMENYMHQGAAAVQGAVQTASQFARTALQPLQDASRLVHSVTGVASIIAPGFSLGRYIDNPLSRLSPKINSVLSNVMSIPSNLTRVSTGVTAITQNVTRLDTSVRNSFDIVSQTASLL